MKFSPEEIESLKKMMLFCIRRKHNTSNGKCGFHLKDLELILEEMEKEGSIKLRPTINSQMYFLNN